MKCRQKWCLKSCAALIISLAVLIKKLPQHSNNCQVLSFYNHLRVHLINQGRCRALETGGAQAAKNFLALFISSQPIVRLRPCSLETISASKFRRISDHALEVSAYLPCFLNKSFGKKDSFSFKVFLLKM